MADDGFSKQAGKAFQNVAIGAAGLVGGLPAVALSVGVGALFNIFDAVANGNDDAFREARIAAVEDEIRRVADEVRKIQQTRVETGKPLNAPDALTQGALFSEFAEAVASAATPEKRTALVHAAALQFDPDLGPSGVRSYWFQQVRALADIEVVALTLLAKHGAVVLRRDGTCWVAVPREEPKRQIPLTQDEFVAMEAIIADMSQGPLISGSVDTAFLSNRGAVVARYATNEEPTPSPFR